MAGLSRIDSIGRIAFSCRSLRQTTPNPDPIWRRKAKIACGLPENGMIAGFDWRTPVWGGDGLHMNSPVTEAENPAAPAPEQAAPVAQQAVAPQQADATQTPQSETAPAEGAKAGRNRRRRGGAGRREGQAAVARTPGDAPAAQGKAAHPGNPGTAQPRRQNPALQQLQGLYPQLFGEQPRPLKRGIFQDLEAAHPGVFTPADLKLALSIHTRSSRYLQAVSQGQPRHDLQGKVVEQMAPEHVFHALVEVFRRRKPRDGEDLTQKLRRRMEIAFESSGMTREAYLELVRGRDDATNALLDEALAEVSARVAKDEAILRAYEASGAASVDAFADMYGMQARTVAQQLERARRLRG